jgi:hypothetical protein
MKKKFRKIEIEVSAAVHVKINVCCGVTLCSLVVGTSVSEGHAVSIFTITLNIILEITDVEI